MVKRLHTTDGMSNLIRQAGLAQGRVANQSPPTRRRWGELWEQHNNPNRRFFMFFQML
jgi:hypothetical protein